MNLPLIVVGVDGSPASRTALRWALGEAMRSGSAVEATMAWQADLLVIGRHAHGPLTEALLGSVTTDCIRHSACPVVVIPPAMTTSSSDAVRVATG